MENECSAVTLVGNVTNNDDNLLSYFTTHYQPFISNEKIEPCFLQIADYNDLSQFINNKFQDKTDIIRKNIFNITYEKDSFNDLKNKLSSHGILASWSEENNYLELESTKTSRANPAILQFSGDIHLKNAFEIKSKLVIFDNVKFVGDNQRITLAKDIGNSNAFLFFSHNAEIPNLRLVRVDKIWLSGEFTGNNFNFVGLNSPFNMGEECAVNINHSANLNITNQLSIKNTNCFNNHGSIIAKEISITYEDQQGQVYLALNSKMIGISEININGGQNITVTQHGLLATHKLSVISTGSFYNNGSLILGKNNKNDPHLLMVNSLFNYANAQIESYNIVEIAAHNPSGNLGLILAQDIKLGNVGATKNQSVFYNGGIIETSNFTIKGNTNFINDARGIIMASKFNSTDRQPPCFNPISNYGGHIINWSKSFDFNISIHKSGVIYVHKKI